MSWCLFSDLCPLNIRDTICVWVPLTDQEVTLTADTGTITKVTCTDAERRKSNRRVGLDA